MTDQKKAHFNRLMYLFSTFVNPPACIELISRPGAYILYVAFKQGLLRSKQNLYAILQVYQSVIYILPNVHLNAAAPVV